MRGMVQASRLSRARYYLDIHGQQGDISDAAFNLVSEESVDGRGSFALDQGPTALGSLTFDTAFPASRLHVPTAFFTSFQTISCTQSFARIAMT